MSSQMNRASPIPTGATAVARCFSIASMKMIKTNSAVRNASMKRPRTTDVSSARPVVAAMPSPGRRPTTRAEAAMLPRSWATMTKPRRIRPTPPVANMAMATAGLNMPPSIRKNALLKESVSGPSRRLYTPVFQPMYGPSMARCRGLIFRLTKRATPGRNGVA